MWQTQIFLPLFLTFSLVIPFHAKQVQNVVTSLTQMMRESVNASNDASKLIIPYFEWGRQGKIINIILNLANVKEHLIIRVLLLSPDAFLFSTGSAPLGQEVIAYFLVHFSDRSGVVNDLLGELEVLSRSASQPAALRPAPLMLITKESNSPESRALIRSAARQWHGDDPGSLQRFPSCEIPAMSQTLGREDNCGVGMSLPPCVYPLQNHLQASRRTAALAQRPWSGWNSLQTFRLSN